eukprot:TRINITY_DN26574_c0_g1_i1.p1 TRINITY_DN26574_c0_g1~~TRINITY_DN26574_c0_g1_i1.p1  ORF type:complete len:324 (+),score=59.65 TRINITY_DN26574_c0_g1_i1:236-1207(+)
MADTKVETSGRLAQWKIESVGPYTYKKSDPFRIGLWNWHLTIERNRCLYIRLFPEPNKVAKELPPRASFVLRFFNIGVSRRPWTSAVNEKLLRTSEDFVWAIDPPCNGRFVIDVEFLDLKISEGGESISVWPTQGVMQSQATKGALACLSCMLDESFYTDLTINTANGSLKAHKAILAARSPVFASMFMHDLKEKESSVINMEDINVEPCVCLLSYIYGSIKSEDFWIHRIALLRAADKYDISDLKECCEESLMEDIDTKNVLDRLQVAWLYQLRRLKKGCFMYLFEFLKVHDLRDDLNAFLLQADRELMIEMFQEMLNVCRA